MIKLFSKSFCVMLLVLICSSAFFAQKRAAKKQSSGEWLMTALINSKTLLGNFSDDGFFCRNSNEREISPDVKRILALGKRAILPSGT